MIVPTYRYRATPRRVIDGDTYLLDVDLGFRVTATIPIRVHAYNAPELADDGGLEAKQYADHLLHQAKQIVIESFKDQRSFERWVADVYVDGVRLGDAMIAAGLGK